MCYQFTVDQRKRDNANAKASVDGPVIYPDSLTRPRNRFSERFEEKAPSKVRDWGK